MAARREVFGLQAQNFASAVLDPTLGNVEIALRLDIGDGAVIGDPRLGSAATGARPTASLVEIRAALIARMASRGSGAGDAAAPAGPGS